MESRLVEFQWFGRRVLLKVPINTYELLAVDKLKAKLDVSSLKLYLYRNEKGQNREIIIATKVSQI